jgi:ligand-binding SRPBCC domain-containing protein
MPTIHLTSHVKAPVDRVFQLSRSTSLHKAVARGYKRGSVEGGTEGVMGPGDKVTFILPFMGMLQILVTKIEALEFPTKFTSTLVKGPFKRMKHEHYFKSIQNGTLLIDVLEYEPGYGPAGKMADRILIRPFLKKYLDAKNRVIKQYAEGEKWKVL